MRAKAIKTIEMYSEVEPGMTRARSTCGIGYSDIWKTNSACVKPENATIPSIFVPFRVSGCRYILGTAHIYV